jgi:hypothetical protein
VATVHRVFHFPDGHVERDEIESEEHYGVGQTEERGGIRFVAREGRAFVEGDPNQVELDFFPDDD